MLAGLAWSQSVKVIDQPFLAGGKYSAITDLAVSKDGNRVAYRHGQEISVASTKDAAVLYTLKGAGRVAFSPDDRLLAATRSQHVDLVDAATGKRLRTLDLPRSFQVLALAFAPNGMTLAISGGTLYHMDLTLWDTARWKQVAEPLHDVDGGARQIVFSRDGLYIAVNHGLVVYAIDAVVGKKIGEVRGISDLIWFDQYDALYRLENGTVTSLPLRKGLVAPRRALQAYTLQPDQVARVAHDPVSGLLAVAIDREVTVRDVGGNVRFRLDGRSRGIATSVAFSGNGKVLVVGRQDGTFDCWRLK